MQITKIAAVSIAHCFELGAIDIQMSCKICDHEAETGAALAKHILKEHGLDMYGPFLPMRREGDGLPQFEATSSSSGARADQALRKYQ